MEERAIVPVQHTWTQEEIDTIKNTVAIGANDSELKMYLALASKYDLDPFAREIWFVQMRGRNSIITGRDGYLKIANRNPQYKGLVSDVVHKGDRFIKKGDSVEHAYAIDNRGPIVGAYALVYRSDRDHPSYFFAPFNEYYKRGGVWDQYPSAMIVKVAESMALKRAFSISGLVTEEEINTEKPKPQAQSQSQQQDEERKTQINQLWQRYFEVCGQQKEHAMNAILKITGKRNSAEFTDEDIQALFADVIRREDEKMNAENAERYRQEHPEEAAIEVQEQEQEQTQQEENNNG